MSFMWSPHHYANENKSGGLPVRAVMGCPHMSVTGGRALTSINHVSRAAM